MNKILVVDDEQAVCEMVRKCLERNGYAVLISSFPEEAVSICQRERPDLVLLDIVMPNVQGTQIIQELNEKVSPRPLIVVTSGLGEIVYHQKEDHWRWEPNRPVVAQRGPVIRERSAQRAAEAYGVEDFLAKPFSPQTLLEVLGEVFERAKKKESSPDGPGDKKSL